MRSTSAEPKYVEESYVLISPSGQLKIISRPGVLPSTGLVIFFNPFTFVFIYLLVVSTSYRSRDFFKYD